MVRLKNTLRKHQFIFLYFLNTHHSAKRTQVFIEELSFSTEFANADETLGRGWNGYFVWSFPHLECARTWHSPPQSINPSAKSSSSKNLLLQHITECFIEIWNENFRFIETDAGGFLYNLPQKHFQIYFLFWFWVQHYATFRFAGWTKTETCFASVTLNKSRK